jgi:serine/threonine-protein kinase
MRHGGHANLYWMRADGGGQPVRLTNSDNMQFPYSFSPDGKWLAFRQFSSKTGNDLWVLPLEDIAIDLPKPGKAEPVLVTPFDENAPMISPEGHWVAYESNESGTREVYVRLFPISAKRWRVSRGRGALPTWSRKRPELFYLGPNGVMVVSYRISGDTFLADEPRVWAQNNNLDWFDVAPDGNRIAVVEAPKSEQDPARLSLLLNFRDQTLSKDSCEQPPAAALCQ